MKYILTTFLSFFVAYSYAEDIKKTKLLPLTKIFKDEEKDRIFTMGVRCGGLSAAINIASKEFPDLINEEDPEQFTKQAQFFVSVAIQNIDSQEKYTTDDITNVQVENTLMYLETWEKNRSNGYFDKVSYEDAEFCEYMFNKFNK